MRAACLIEEVQRLLDRQSGLYSVYSDAIHKYKSSKDATAFANARKKLDGDYRSITNQITQVQISLTKEQPEAAEKVRADNAAVICYQNCVGPNLDYCTFQYCTMRTLLLKTQPIVTFFIAVNQCSGPLMKQRHLAQRGQKATYKHCDWWISIHFASFCIFCGQSVVVIIMIDGSKTCKFLVLF